MNTQQKTYIKTKNDEGKGLLLCIINEISDITHKLTSIIEDVEGDNDIIYDVFEFLSEFDNVIIHVEKYEELYYNNEINLDTTTQKRLFESILKSTTELMDKFFYLINNFHDNLINIDYFKRTYNQLAMSINDVILDSLE